MQFAPGRLRGPLILASVVTVLLLGVTAWLVWRGVPFRPSVTTPDAAIAAVQRSYPVVRGITPRPGALIGSHSDVKAVKNSTGFRVTFWKGMGDCFAGCISKHFWVFQVTPQGRVTLLREYGTSAGGGLQEQRRYL